MMRGSKPFWKTTLLLPVALVAAACGNAPRGELPGEFAEPIVGGEVDTEHHNVFMLFAIHRDYYSTCTATLIGPNLLLTARHCVAENEDEAVICGRAELGATFAAESLRASNPVDVGEATRWFQGASVHVPSEGSDTCGFDVALLVLTENVPRTVAVPAIPRIDREVSQGEPYVAVGYGLDEAGEAGARLSRDGLFVSCAPGRCGRVAPESEFVGDTGVCEGDSGGPAFDADGKLVGIVSRGGEDCSVPIYGSVASWREWITGIAVQAAARGNYEPPFWVTSGTSDPPPVLPAAPGAACGGEVVCSEGHVCHAGESGESTCVRSCVSERDCDLGFSCEPAEGTSVCVATEPASAEPDATCAASNVGAGSRTPLYLAGLMTGLGWLRSRRRRAVK